MNHQIVLTSSFDCNCRLPNFVLLWRSVGLDCQYFDSEKQKFRQIKANRAADPDKEVICVLSNLAVRRDKRKQKIAQKLLTACENYIKVRYDDTYIYHWCNFEWRNFDWLLHFLLQRQNRITRTGISTKFISKLIQLIQSPRDCTLNKVRSNLCWPTTKLFNFLYESVQNLTILILLNRLQVDFRRSWRHMCGIWWLQSEDPRVHELLL